MKKLCFLLCVGLLLSACGRMSRPLAPEGSTYPQTYVVQE